MTDKVIMGALFCLTAAVTWGAQFPIAGRALGVGVEQSLPASRRSQRELGPSRLHLAGPVN
jgi:hypothetical protein